MLPSLDPPASAAQSRAVTLFDFDGVLVRSDCLAAFVFGRMLRSPWRLGLALLASPCVLAVSALSCQRAWHLLIRIALLGLDEAGYAAALPVFAARHARLAVPPGVAALRSHLADGDRVIIVTGCEARLARATLHAMGISGVEVLGSSLRSARFGLAMDWHNIRARKVALLHQHSLSAWQTAYSDSGKDVPMLAQADCPVLVNAGRRLAARAQTALPRTPRLVTWR